MGGGELAEGRQDARKFATKEKKNKFAKTASPTAPDVIPPFIVKF